MRRLAVALLLVSAACAGARAPTAPTSPTPPPAGEMVVSVDATRTRQAIEDVAGGNFIHSFSRVTDGLDAIGRFNLDGLQPRHIRLRMALEDWEPAPGDFRDEGYNHGAFLLAQEAAARGIELTASIWDVPGWMVTNPSSDRNRKIPPSMYPQLAESMARWLRTARDVYGAPVSLVSFNEADIGVNVALSSAEYAALIADVGARLEARGLRVRWLLGDCSNMAGCVAYARPIWDDAAARPYLGAFAFHTWDSGAADATLAGLADFGGSTGLPVRATEGGWDAFLWQRPDQFPSWTNGLRLAMVYARVLKLAGASIVQYWQMLGRDYLVNDGAVGYPAFQVLQQLQRELPAGSHVVETSGDRGLVTSLAARDARDLAVVLVNGGVAQPLRLSGVPSGSYRRTRISGAGVQSLAPVVVSAGTLGPLTLERESVELYSTRP